MGIIHGSGVKEWQFLFHMLLLSLTNFVRGQFSIFMHKVMTTHLIRTQHNTDAQTMFFLYMS